MKKVYLAPQTEATELIANTVLMTSPGNGFTLPYGDGNGDGMR